jgi:phosphatidylcholine synthase
MVVPGGWPAIVVSSAIYYADTGMKTDEILLLRLPGRLEHGGLHPFRHRPGENELSRSSIVVIVSVFLTFVPVSFLHPVRVQRLRPLNLAGVFLAWCAAWRSMRCCLHIDASPAWVQSGASAWRPGSTSIVVGAVLQLFPETRPVDISGTDFLMAKAIRRPPASAGPRY